MSAKVLVVAFLCEIGLFTPIAMCRADQSAVRPNSATLELKVRISWGHRSKAIQAFQISFLTNDLAVTQILPVGFEAGDSLQAGVCETRAGAGDVDALDLTLCFPQRNIQEMHNLQQIWKYLFAISDADTERRLRLDAGFRPDDRKLTVQMDNEGTRGFSLTVDQLFTSKAFWIPDLDVFVSTGDRSISFDAHQKELKAWAPKRIITQLESEPEASYEQYTSRWDDMGSPAYTNPASVPPGHIVCLTWDSAIPKFGIDRSAGVRNDYGNPDHFQFSYDFGELSNLGGLGPAPAATWIGQKLTDGLPVMTTTIERDGVRYEIEQFAYPLKGPPKERRGNLQMVLLQKIRMTELRGQSRILSLGLAHQRELPPGSEILVRTNGAMLLWFEANSSNLVLAVEGTAPLTLQSNRVQGTNWQTNRIVLSADLSAHGSKEFVVKLPSPLVQAIDTAAFMVLDYPTARSATIAFWSDYLARGALFSVPEEAVNNLFRANLWHALRLPRRHDKANVKPRVDLPYSNFAYDQKGTPWPVNQSVYVDYMLYDLRGYHPESAEELESIYENNQEANGHVSGFANWGVYTPAMMYSVAQHYLLSGDRRSLERLLPQTLKGLDWCLDEIKRNSDRGGFSSGLVLAPLNDLSHDAKAWAFNQAYFYAGLRSLGKVLAEYHHPRAEECLAAARSMYDAIQRSFAHASMQSPLVQLRDHTWIPYVPSDALSARRLLEIWYPTDVDCGSLHLPRLKALDPTGPLASFLLNDHEDNLFLKQWGMANEPVYNPHATTYLLRDEVNPAIRAFYSMMACAFSHSCFEPVEHRWGWGQYFGPPSTDGAWFDLYRHMLIHERDDDSLLLCQATPRKWLEDGKQIRIRGAPTYFGLLNLSMKSHDAARTISAVIDLEQRKRPAALLLRLRHPQARRLRSVLVNGQRWSDFDPMKEWVRISDPVENRFTVLARY